MKYILFALPNATISTVRIFDDITGHNEVKAEVQSGKPGLEVVSAGQIWINGNGLGVTCIHTSVSLGLSYDEATSDMAAATIKNLLKSR